MGMPEIPEGKFRPSMEETIIDLLESIALEEMALSHILNAQGEKLQHFIKLSKNECITFNDIEQSFKSTNKTLIDIIMKEWLLIVKMNNIESLANAHCNNKKYNYKKHKHHHHDKCYCERCSDSKYDDCD